MPVHTGTAVHTREWFLAMDLGHPYALLLPHLQCSQVWEEPATHQVVFSHLSHLQDRNGPVCSLSFDGHVWHKVRDYSDRIEPWKTIKATLSEGRLRDPFDYHAMAWLGWQPAQMGQAKHLRQIYAPLAGVLTWMKEHQVFPHFLEPDGGPWCPIDNAEHCPGCAGQLRPTGGERRPWNVEAQ